MAIWIPRCLRFICAAFFGFLVGAVVALPPPGVIVFAGLLAASWLIFDWFNFSDDGKRTYNKLSQWLVRQGIPPNIVSHRVWITALLSVVLLGAFYGLFHSRVEAIIWDNGNFGERPLQRYVTITHLKPSTGISTDLLIEFGVDRTNSKGTAVRLQLDLVPNNLRSEYWYAPPHEKSLGMKRQDYKRLLAPDNCVELHLWCLGSNDEDITPYSSLYVRLTAFSPFTIVDCLFQNFADQSNEHAKYQCQKGELRYSEQFVQ